MIYQGGDMKHVVFRTIFVLLFLVFGLHSSLWAEVRNLHIEMYPYVVQANQVPETQAVHVVPSGAAYTVSVHTPSEIDEELNTKIRSFYETLQAELHDGRISYDQYLERLACWYADPGQNPCAALSEDGTLAAISRWMGDVTIYDTQTGKQRCVLEAPESFPSGFVLPKMQFSTDGTLLAVLLSRSEAPDMIFIYETETGTLRHKIQSPRLLFFPSGEVRMLAQEETCSKAAVCAKEAIAVPADLDFSLQSAFEAGQPWNLPSVTDSVQKQGQFAAIRKELLIYVMDVPRQMKVSGGFTSMETPLAGIIYLHDLRKPGAAAFYPVLNEDGGAVCTLMNPVFSEKQNCILFTTNTERIVKFSLDTHQAEWVSPKGVFGASSPDHAISYPYPQNAAFLTSNHGLQVQCGLLRHRFVMDGKVVEESIALRRDPLNELFQPQYASVKDHAEEILCVQKLLPDGIQTLRELFPGKSCRVVSSCLTSDGRYAAAGIQNMKKDLETGYVVLWETRTGKELAVCRMPNRKITFTQLQFMPDGKTLVVLALSCGNQECTLLHVEVPSGKVLRDFPLKK